MRGVFALAVFLPEFIHFEPVEFGINFGVLFQLLNCITGGAGMKDNTMKRIALTILLFLLPLSFIGCGGSGSDKKTGSVIPSKQNSVETVLQQKMAEADRQNADNNKGKETVHKQTAAGEASAIQDKQDVNAPVSAKKMKELEDNTPRHDVYDLHPSYTKVDYDFSKMDKNMMYTQIYNMLKTPDEYKGKVVRMQGTFGHYYDEKTGKHYFGCVVMDATACCSTGMEFSRKGKHIYPDNYPRMDEPIRVTGRFTSYKEGKELFCELADAEMEKL